MPLNKALLRTIEGVSPIVCREIEYKVMEGATNRIEGVLFDRLAVEIEKLKSVCSDCSGKPVVVYREDGKPMDFCFMNVEQYGDFAKVESKESFSDLLDGFYEARDSRDRMRVKSQSLTKLLNNTLERLARKLQSRRVSLNAVQTVSIFAYAVTFYRQISIALSVVRSMLMLKTFTMRTTQFYA